MRLSNRTPKSPVFFLRLLLAAWSLVHISTAADIAPGVNLAWDPNPEANIAGYRVQYGTTSGILIQSLTVVGTSPAATLSGLEPGTRHYCAVRAFDTAGLEGPLSSEISFIVPGTTAPEIAVEQASGGYLADGQGEISLGQVEMGSTGAARTFVISNPGTADLTGLAITVDGAEFAVSPLDRTTLAPGETASFDVTFSPSVGGIRSALIQITSNDADENPFDIGLVALAVALPEIAIQHSIGFDLTDASSTVDFTNSLPGTTSAPQIFTIKNTGTADLTGIGISIDGVASADFILGPPVVSTLAPGTSTTFSIAFAPTVSGLRSATLHVASNDADEDPFDIVLSGSGIARPEIAVHTADGTHLAAIDFHDVNLGSTSVARTFTISNPGSATLTDLALVIEGDQISDFIVTAPVVASLEPGESTTFKVAFAPGAEGARGAMLRIYSNDPDGSPCNITLAGIGVAIPDISVTQTDGIDLSTSGATMNLGSVNVGMTGPVRIFSIANLGTADLSDLEITLDGLHDTDFTVDFITEESLPPGTDASVQVTFSPTADGTRTATLRIASNDPDENSIDIELTGFGVAVPEITVSGPDGSALADAAGTQEFGGVYLTNTGEARTYTLLNSGTADLTGLVISSGGTDAADFIVSPLAVTSLAPGASTTLRIAFQPSAAGTRTATLHIASNDPGTSSFDIALKGSGLTIPILALENADGTPVESGDAVAAFGSVIVGATGDALTYVVRNTGTADLTGIRIATAGLHAASFVLCLPSVTTLAPGASTRFTVTFKPTNAGAKSAVIRITSDSTLPEAFEIGIRGTGSAVPEITVYQDDNTSLTSGTGSVSFGNCNLGATTITRTFTIRNTGSATLSRLSVASGNPDFNLGNLGSTSLAPGASTNFKVSFQPSTAGTRSTQLVIASNDADEEQFLIALTGKGIEVPEIGVELSSGKSLTDDDAFINFGTVDVGTTTKSQVFTIRNSGTVKLSGLAITKNGINSQEFGVGALRTRFLAPGASTTFKVNFSPAKAGIRWAAIHITSNDPDENSFDIVLTGTGRKSPTSARAAAGLTGNPISPTSTPGKGVAVIGGRKYLTLTIIKTPGSTTAPRDFEVSSNLVDWSSGKRHTTVLLDNATTLTVRDNTPLTRDAKRYIRLRR